MNINLRSFGSHAWEICKDSFIIGGSLLMAKSIFNRGAQNFTVYLLVESPSPGRIALVAWVMHEMAKNIFARLGWQTDNPKYEIPSVIICGASTFGLACAAAQGNQIAAYVITGIVVYGLANAFLFGTRMLAEDLKGVFSHP